MQFLIDNIVLIAVAFISGAMLVWPLIRGRASGPSLSTLQATQLINTRNPQIVDLRSADDFSKGSLPNARNLPTDKINDRMAELKKDKPVLLVCAHRDQCRPDGCAAPEPRLHRGLRARRRHRRVARGRTAAAHLSADGVMQ